MPCQPHHEGGETVEAGIVELGAAGLRKMLVTGMVPNAIDGATVLLVVLRPKGLAGTGTFGAAETGTATVTGASTGAGINGANVGRCVGRFVGARVGDGDGAGLGALLGTADGPGLGSSDGTDEGATVG